MQPCVSGHETGWLLQLSAPLAQDLTVESGSPAAQPRPWSLEGRSGPTLCHQRRPWSPSH